MAIYNTYSVEQEAFLKENAPLMSRKELTECFNKTFGANRTVSGIKHFCNSRGYNSSSTGRFQEGHISWQTGLRGEDFKSHYTAESFQRGIEGMRQANKTRKIGSDMADSVTGGGLHGKDLSKADVSVNIYAFLKAQNTRKPVELCCAIGDETIDGRPYEEIVDIARDFIRSVGGFEKFAEWGLF